MATSQQYSLRWNNYLKHITYAFDNLRSQDDFVDVTLCCDGKKIKAHKVLLSACSGYFKEIFKENPCPHPIIIFKFIKYEDLLAIIEFMYQGEVNVQQEALQSFLQTAELLAVQGLTSEEKEKPPPVMKISKMETLKTIPTTIRTISDNNCNTQQAQTQTIQLQATVLQPSTVAQTTTHQGGGGPLSKKRKITFTTAVPAPVPTTDDDDDVYTETVEFTTKDDKTSTEVQYIPTMNVGIPEYIDVSDTKQLSESQVQQTQQSSQDTTTQTTSQYTTSEYEILAESEIEKFDTTGGNESGEITTVDIGNGQVYTVQEAKPEICKIEKNSQDLPNNKWTECQFCKMVITTVNLWRHIRTQHTPQPPRKCDLCNKNFKNKYSLREHIRISHEQKQQQTKGLITTTTSTTATLKKES